MLISLILAAKDNASQAIKGITASFVGMTSSAESAAKASKSVGIKDGEAAKVAALRSEIGLNTQSLRANLAAESLRAAKASVDVARAIADERRWQDVREGSQKSALALTRAENQLAAARAKASIASEKFNLNASKAGLADLEKSLLGVERTGSGLGRLSSMLGNILPGNFGTLANAGGGAFGGITEGISASELAIGGLVGAVSLGLVGAFMAAAKAASYFGDEFGKSVNRQKETISAAEPLVKGFGLSYEEADKNVKATQERIAILGRDLPVSSSEINTVVSGISDNLAGMLNKAGLGIGDLAKFQDTIGSKGAILTASTQSSTSTDFNRVFDKLDSGTTIAGLKNLQLYEQSPQLRSALDETFKKYNIKNTSDLKASDKPNFMLDLLNSAVTDEQVKRLQGSVAAQISSFTDKLFDPNIGIFGLERDLDKQKDGTQSVFSSISRGISILIGDNGILSNISTILGGTGDPMKALYDGLEGFNNWLQSVNEFLKKFSESKEKVDAFRGALGYVTANPIATPQSNEQAGKDAVNTGWNALKLINDGMNAINDHFFPPAQPKFGGSPNLTAHPAAGGFMGMGSAIMSEMRNKPTGSGLVIANSSETVLTPEQLSSMSSQSSQTIKTENRSLTLGSGAIVINASQGMDVSALLDQMMERLDSEFNKSVTGLLA